MSDDQAQQRDEHDEHDEHDDCMQRFIDLANTMKDERVPVSVVSWALMTASGIYATYSVTGNSGGLNPSGIEKVADAYKQNLSNIQSLRKNQEAQSGIGKRVSAPTEAQAGSAESAPGSD